MLDPEYLLEIAEGAENLASELHSEIIARIIKRITIRIGRNDDYILTPIDKWQLEVLEDAGYLREDLGKLIAEKTRLEIKEIKAAFEDAGVETLKYDDEIYKAAGLSPAPLMQSPYLIRLLQRGYEATQGEWINFTRTTADAAQQLFISECDRAYNLVAAGAVSYTQAVKDAVERIASDGVRVTYPSGHSDTIETATLRAVRTGISQACANVTDARMDEMDWDIILVSAHLGARVTDAEDFTNHYWWQGKFYSKSGNDTRFPPFSVCGMGDVQGIHGANCRHSHGPGDGIHNPFEKFDAEENKKLYELQQRQRALERRIRKTKREVMGLKTAADNLPDGVAKDELTATYHYKAYKLRRQNAQYKAFCEANKLKPLQDRLKIAKWDRKQASAAAVAAKTYNGVARAERTKGESISGYSVDEKRIQSQSYRMKYHGITGDARVDDRICESARSLLTMKSGTAEEGLILFDRDTGKTIYSKLINSIDLGVQYNKDIYEAIAIARRDGSRIIALHNHPGGVPPSADDAVSALVHGYDFGVVAGHNGEVYTYQPSRHPYSVAECERIQNNINLQLIGQTDIYKTWSDMLSLYGIKIERR